MEFGNSAILNVVNGSEPFSDLVSDEARETFVDVEEEGTLIGTFNGKEVRTPADKPVVLGTTGTGGYASTDQKTADRMNAPDQKATPAPKAAPAGKMSNELGSMERAVEEDAIDASIESDRQSRVALAVPEPAKKEYSTYLYDDPAIRSQSAGRYTSKEYSDRYVNDSFRALYSYGKGETKLSATERIEHARIVKEKGLTSSSKELREGSRLVLRALETESNREGGLLLAAVRADSINANTSKEAGIFLQRRLAKMFGGDVSRQEAWRRSEEGQQVWGVAYKTAASLGAANTKSDRAAADIEYKEATTKYYKGRSPSSSGTGYDAVGNPVGASASGVSQGSVAPLAGTEGKRYEAMVSWGKRVSSADASSALMTDTERKEVVALMSEDNLASDAEINASALRAINSVVDTEGSPTGYLKIIAGSKEYAAISDKIVSDLNATITAQNNAVWTPLVDGKENVANPTITKMSNKQVQDYYDKAESQIMTSLLNGADPDAIISGLKNNTSEQVVEQAKVLAASMMFADINPRYAKNYPTTEAELAGVTDQRAHTAYAAVMQRFDTLKTSSYKIFYPFPEKIRKPHP